MGKKIIIVYKGLKFMKEEWGPLVLSAVIHRDIAAAMSCVFKNLGNTCFTSSDLQCVSHSSTL